MMSSYTFAEVEVEAGEMQKSSESHSWGLRTTGQDEEARIKPPSTDIILVKYFCTAGRGREDTHATFKMYRLLNVIYLDMRNMRNADYC